MMESNRSDFHFRYISVNYWIGSKKTNSKKQFRRFLEVFRLGDDMRVESQMDHDEGCGEQNVFENHCMW